MSSSVENGFNAHLLQAHNVMFNAPSDNSKDNFTVDNKLFGF